MPGKSSHLELPRRVTAYYLVFGLAAIGWLTIGVVVVARSIVSLHAESTCLSDLGSAAGALVAEYSDGGVARLQPLVDRIGAMKSYAYCAVADPSGKFLAHSLHDLVGQKAGEPTGAVVQWGDVVRVRFVDSDSRVLREYRTPVRVAGKPLGTLLVAVVEPGLWGIVTAVTSHAPAAILGPLLLMFLGICVLQRTVRPLTEIERQLDDVAAAPSPAEVELKPVSAESSAASGWNRLAEQYSLARKTGAVESRLSAALEGFRQRKADQILNSLPEGIALTDDQGKVTFANQAAGALLGSPGDHGALGGKTMEDLLGLDAGNETAKAFLDPDSRARTVVAELNGSGDRSQGVLRVARHPLRGANGSPGTGHVWSIRDVTQQKLAEQMRNQFVNSATHELRTPLANIKAYAETLTLSDMLDVEQQKQFCNTINSEATRLARLIDDLLSISSMEVGALSLSRQETDTERLFHEVVDKVRPQMAQRNITLRSSLPEKFPKMRVDKDKIVGTLVNLLGNAAKYTPEGGQVHFKVQVKQDVVQIDVEDTGFGISAEELPKVFDKFFRSSDPRVRQQTGSGLGLSLVQEVVRLHGGKLGVQSELNKGTRFTVTLPLA